MSSCPWYGGEVHSVNFFVFQKDERNREGRNPGRDVVSLQLHNPPAPHGFPSDHRYIEDSCIRKIFKGVEIAAQYNICQFRQRVLDFLAMKMDSRNGTCHRRAGTSNAKSPGRVPFRIGDVRFYRGGRATGLRCKSTLFVVSMPTVIAGVGPVPVFRFGVELCRGKDVTAEF